MAEEEEFNPYHKWLGIPPAEQPPNHYRLLGIELFESDLEVIESAADQRMAHLRTFQGGKNAQLSQKLLNEVSKARICLLKPDSKQEYDDSIGIPGEAKADFSGAPPVQIDQDRNPLPRSSAMLPLAIVVFILLAGAGTVFAVLQFGQPADDDPALTQNNVSDVDDSNNGDKEKRKLKLNSDNVVDPNKKEDPNKNGDNPGGNAKEPAKEKESEKEKVGDITGKKEPGKSGDSKSKKNPEKDPDKSNDDKSDEKKKSGEMPNKSNDKKGDKNKGEDDKPKGGGDPPKKDDKPLIIKTKTEKEKETVVRSPLPPAERWKPYVTPLKKEYDVKDEMSRDARYGLFYELISDAADETRGDKAYALFNLAMEEAKQLHHSAGAEEYCTEFCKRFEFDLPTAKTLYLKSIAGSLKSKPHVTKFLVEAQRLIKQSEEEKKFGLAVQLLEAIVGLANQPEGKDINKSWFEMWLAADQKLHATMKDLDELNRRRKSNQLSPKQHLALGSLECFVNNQWETGLDHFSKSEFKPVVDIAKKSRDVNISKVHSIAEIADAWWVLASKVEEEEYLFKLRAKHWYDEYQKVVTPTEISKKIQKRIEDLTLGIGLKRVPVARSPSHVLLLNRDREVTPGAATTPAHLLLPNPAAVGILAKEDNLGDISSRFRIVRVDNQTEILDDSSGGFIDHPPLSIAGKLAWLKPRVGLVAYDIRELLGTGQNGSPNEIFFRTSEPIRAFDIGKTGDVFALGGKFIFWWNPQQAWNRKNASTRKPTRFESPVSFIPNRIRIIPNSSTVALASSRFLVRVNPVSKGISELHTSGELNDFDFASNGNAVVTALKNGIRFKAFKGNKDLFFQTAEALKVRFLPNPRFIVSLHDDHSIRIWDTSEKNDDFLIERFDLPDYEPIAFAIARNGSSIALVDDATKVLLLDCYYE